MIKENYTHSTGKPENYYALQGNMVVFQDKYKTGISILDDQHKGLAGAINTLFHQMRHQNGKPAALPMITAFKHYAGIHYNTEKAVLAFYEPEYGALYDLRYEELCKRLLKEESLFQFNRDPGNLLEYLKSWWLLHMENHREFFMPVERGGSFAATLPGFADAGRVIRQKAY